jgi:hypothetical protein
MKKLCATLLPAVLLMGSAALLSGQEKSAETASAAAPLPGQLTETQLGEMLAAMGVKPRKTEQRYDFSFKTTYQGEEWTYTMSTVLSRTGESIWVMAWLDPIPQSANEVPRTALLRLLAANDRLGNGKFFAYIPTNKRFVMQRIVKNENMNNKEMMKVLKDLAASVADEYATWSVSSWAPKSDQQLADQDGSERNVPENPTAASRSAAPAKPVKTSENGSEFDGKRIQ